MKKSHSVFIIVISILFFSCKSENQKTEKTESLGKINSISLVINDDLWSGEVGDSIRKKFAAPVDGLPQEEPIFTINQYPVRILEGNSNRSRNIVVVKQDSKNRFEVIKNEFATPQNVIYISGTSIQEIINQLEINADSIIKIIDKTEIVQNQNLFRKSLLVDEKIRKKFRISLLVPSTYKYVLVKPNFIWLKNEVLSGNTSIVIYKVPIKSVMKNNDYVNNIIAIRDSMGAKYIHGKVRNTRMITEESYSPYFEKTFVDNKLAFETKGTWEMKGDYMSGSFINYAIIDKKSKKCIIIDGFCYAPSTEKRDLMHELKSIIRSVKTLK
ncbi:MAG: DUF4837 family protein [Flavobacterium sp.]